MGEVGSGLRLHKPRTSSPKWEAMKKRGPKDLVFVLYLHAVLHYNIFLETRRTFPYAILWN